MSVFQRLSFIDTLFVILWLVIVYIVFRRGVIEEYFRIIGILLGMILGFHFYPQLRDIIAKKAIILSKTYLDIGSYVIIVIGCAGAFTMAGKIVAMFFKRPVLSLKVLLVSFLLGSLRFFLLSHLKQSGLQGHLAVCLCIQNQH